MKTIFFRLQPITFIEKKRGLRCSVLCFLSQLFSVQIVACGKGKGHNNDETKTIRLLRIFNFFFFHNKIALITLIIYALLHQRYKN